MKSKHGFRVEKQGTRYKIQDTSYKIRVIRNKIRDTSYKIRGTKKSYRYKNDLWAELYITLWLFVGEVLNVVNCQG